MSRVFGAHSWAAHSAFTTTMRWFLSLIALSLQALHSVCSVKSVVPIFFSRVIALAAARHSATK